MLKELKAKRTQREANLDVFKCSLFFCGDECPGKLVPLSGHFPGFSMYLFGMVSLPQPLLDWLLALQIQLEPQESVHISHVLAPLESWDSDAVQLQRADIFNWYLTPLLSFQIRHHHKQPILPPTSAWARMGMLHQCLTEVGSQLG